jgi:hypothetical protein
MKEEIGCSSPGFKRERKIKAKYVSFKAPLFIYELEFIIHNS